jgi:uncharacterized protein YcbX
MAIPSVAVISIFPVKSLGGVSISEAEVQPWGLRHDRRWLVLNQDGTVLTARAERRMLGLTATPVGDSAIELTARDGSSVRVATPADGEVVSTSLSRLESVRAAATDADDWLSDQLDRPVRLCWLDDPGRRTISVDHGGRPGEPLNLSDAGPLLLTSSTSLAQLNEWMTEDAHERGADPPTPVKMERFRPTVVVDGISVAFVEDGWRQLRIGGVEFRFAERCDRCVLTTIDPHTLEMGKEPLRTLARHRQWDHKTFFGIRIIPAGTGTIRAGDAVTSM